MKEILLASVLENMFELPDAQNKVSKPSCFVWFLLLRLMLREKQARRYATEESQKII